MPQPLIVENGDMVRLVAAGATIVDEVPIGRLASDGKTLLPLDGSALKDRRRIVFNGSAVATLVVDRQGRLSVPPAITVMGLVEPEAVEAVLPALRTAIERSFDELPAGARRDNDAITEAAKRSLRRVLNERFGKRPLVEIQVMRI